MMREFDYIIVGGGSAGCVAASRLVRDHDARVLLIEAGPPRYSDILSIPAGYMKFLASDRYLSMHKTDAQPQLGGRGVIVPQARVLGGGSTVNAMVYMRGHEQDYADWTDALDADAPDWSWRALLPHYRAMEDNDHLGAPLHGVGGPLKVSHLGHTSPMTRAYVKAMQGMGLPYTPDFNDGAPYGVGFMQHTIDWRTHRRSGAVDAFLRPLRGDPRLTIVTDAAVTQLSMTGTIATGVTYTRRGRTFSVRAGREILLAAGAFQTPKLLMLSGIGPEQELRAHGIPVRHALRGVGGNLQDHYEVPVVATTRGAFGYYGQDRGWPMVRAGLQYALTGSGAATTTGVESCAFFDPEDLGGRPTIQMFCVPTVYLDRDVMGTPPGHGVTVNSLLLRPQSRGRVRLRSADPSAQPRIDTQIFAHAEDLRRTIAGFRFARRVLDQEPVRAMISREIFPGPDVVTDAALAEHCRRTVKTGYHPVGTCRMGRADDADAVIDADLRVHGIERLRVIDASMMPNIVSGNTNAAVMAVASRAVDLMRRATQPRTISGDPG